MCFVVKHQRRPSLSQAKNVNLRSDLHSLIALAFDPVADVKDNFDDLVETIDPSLAMVVAHIHKYYIHGRCVGKKLIDPVFPPAIWNCHERVLNDLPRILQTYSKASIIN